MRLIYREGRIEIWSVGGEFWVYGCTRSDDPIVCPSLGMAQRDRGALDSAARPYDGSEIIARNAKGSRTPPGQPSIGSSVRK
ncbi:hypothetical protein ABIB06_007415 [Bradyrhizobium sp. LB8.2]|uniref:hypothetical protein n=1 Tax=unclassified Bradyrhizobium TaxID=2631580 RepID=UPI003396C16D